MKLTTFFKTRTYFLFAGLSLIWIPTIYLCEHYPTRCHKTNANDTVYPETRNRSLESIEALFSTSSPFNWKMEQAFESQAEVLVDEGISTDTGKPELEMIA